MIFIDSNIPMYLVGAPHANKEGARRAVELCIGRGERMVSSAEVMQEILHRYSSLRRLDAIQPALDTLLGIVDEIYPIEQTDVARAKDVLIDRPVMSARDALHVAVMKKRRIERIMSFDTHFDAIPWIERVY